MSSADAEEGGCRMITQGEAKMEAAAIALRYLAKVPRCPTATPEVDAELAAIEAWLRRRALGGDKIAIRQTERELGRQVKTGGRRR